MPSKNYIVVSAQGLAKRIQSHPFFTDTSGAVTADFVVIVATVVSLSLSAATVVARNTLEVAHATSDQIAMVAESQGSGDGSSENGGSDSSDDSDGNDENDPAASADDEEKPKSRAERRAERQAARAERRAARQAARAKRRAERRARRAARNGN